jgi:hypothetical protein
VAREFGWVLPDSAVAMRPTPAHLREKHNWDRATDRPTGASFTASGEPFATRVSLARRATSASGIAD